MPDTAKASAGKSPNAPAAPSESELEGAKLAMETLNELEAPDDSIPENFDPSKVVSIDTRREEAKIPEHRKARTIMERPTIFVSWRPQRGMLRSTGELRPGYFCVCMDVETKRAFTVWIGQVALFRELQRVKPPFRAKIVEDGRTLKFVSA